MLLDTIIVFFRTFGGFLCLAVVTAIVHALVFFPALLNNIGPEGHCGESPWVRQFVSRFRKREIGLYDKNYHIPRDEAELKVSRVKYIWIYYVFIALLSFAIHTTYSFRTETGLFTPQAAVAAPSPSPPELPSIENMTEQVWYEISPAGDTLCGRGRPFSFFFKKGSSTTNSLIVEFEGGGICFK